MNKILIGIGAVFLIALGVLVLPIVTAFFGGIAGWVFAGVFSESFLAGTSLIGATGISGFKLGAFLGFFGGFFRSIQSNSK